MSHIRGYNYEKQLKIKLQTENVKSWLWNDIPEYDLRKSDLLGDWNEHRWLRKTNKINNLPDLGADLLIKDENTQKYKLIQCKNFTNSNVSIDHLGGFYAMLTHYNHLDGIVYYNSGLSNNLKIMKETDKVKFIKETYIDYENNEEKHKYYEKIIDNPYYYQIEAYEKLKDSNRSILSLPCGMGKTLTSILIAKDYENIIIISPLIAHAEQNLENYINQLKDFEYNSIFVSCEGNRDENDILDILSKNKKNILSFTYRSIDILTLIIDKIPNKIIILDEFHNLSKNDIFDESNNFYKILHSESKILFMSATPKIFNLGDDDISEIINQTIFGTDIYSFSMAKAIQEKYICDYEIYLPDIKNKNNLDNISKEIDIKDFSNELLIKAKYIMRGMLETGSKKCIIYLRNQDEVKDIIECIKKLEEYFVMNIYVEGIISDTHKNERSKILDIFTNFKGFSIICSVQILDECIDIPSCDSIFISYKSESKIRNIQRLCRANRKDKFNIHKKARIFLWCDEFNDTSIFISQLKSFDESFIENKIILLNTNENDGGIIDRIDKNKQIYNEINEFIISIKSFGYGIDSWKKNLSLLKEFINFNNKLPNITKEDEKYLCHWIYDQKLHYKKKQFIMKLPEIRSLWDDFIIIHKDHFSEPNEIWNSRLNDLENFILTENRLPTQGAKEDEFTSKLAKWIVRNNDEFDKKIKAMNNIEIRNIWTEFKNKYESIFNQKSLENIDEWFSKYKEFELFVTNNKRLPYENKDKPKEYPLRIWLKSNIKTYDKNKFEKSNDKKIAFEKLLASISSYLQVSNNIDIWKENLERLDDYIQKYEKLPPEKVKIDDSIKGEKREELEKLKSLGTWKSNFLQDAKTEFKTFCLDIDLTRVSSTEKNKILKQIEKYNTEKEEYKEILSKEYSTLSKTERVKYDKIKDKLVKRDEDIKKSREEAIEKYALFTSLKIKYPKLF
jgi:superfamily II DNA or RNA helicase